VAFAAIGGTGFGGGVDGGDELGAEAFGDVGGIVELQRGEREAAVLAGVDHVFRLRGAMDLVVCVGSLLHETDGVGFGKNT
jgi:hypothetical protein